LDHARLLIHGNPASLGAVTGTLFDSSERKTAIVEATSDSSHLVGQVIHHRNSRIARLSFLQMDDPASADGLPALVDFLSYQAGESQATNLLADIEGTPGLFETLRRSGFSAYGIETIWRLPKGQSQVSESDTAWRTSSGKNETAMRNLYQNVTPPLEQSAEPCQMNSSNCMIHCSNDEIAAWVLYVSGPLGIYLVPVFHPSLKEPIALLRDLAGLFSNSPRPVYLQIRSHQSWLNPSLEELGAQPSGQYTLLVKHLAVAQKAAVINGQRVHADPRQAKPTVPIMRNLTPDAPGGIKKRTKINN